MITMRSDWWNADSYYPWIDPLVEAAFGAEIDLHWDLYLQTHAHRLQHGPRCEAYPSPPSRAPLWAFLAGQMPSPPEVILETGTGIDYAIVLIADAFPRSRLFAVERDAQHPRIAEQTFELTGVADRITIVPSMKEARIARSDLVFVDGPVVNPARSLPCSRCTRHALDGSRSAPRNLHVHGKPKPLILKPFLFESSYHGPEALSEPYPLDVVNTSQS